MSDSIEELMTSDLIREAGLKSYDEWNKRGRYILKGEKCVLFFDGKAYFQKDQTANKKTTKRRPIEWFDDGTFIDSTGIYEINPDATWSFDQYSCIESFIPNSY